MDKIIFIDVLTTGMDSKRCALYAIGGIICENTAENTKEIQRFEMKICPWDGAKIYENSLWIGGITRGDLIRYPKEADSLEQFIKMISPHVNVKNPNDKLYLAGFNASSFDQPFIREWFERNGNNNFRNYFYVQTLDLMSLSAFALLPERKGMSDFYLKTVAKFLGVTPTTNEKYNCIDNAETCLKMYRVLKERLKTGLHGEDTRTENIYKNF